MKNLECLIADMKSNEELRKAIRNGLNRMRNDETLEIHEAGIRIAHELGYEISDYSDTTPRITSKTNMPDRSLKVSDFIEIFRSQSYPKLFSNECLNALQNIQNIYSHAETHHVIYELSLSEPALTTDFSCRLHDELLRDYWLEFDFNIYASGGNISHCTFLETVVPAENEEMIRSLIGSNKFNILRQPLNDLYNFLKSKGLGIVYIGTLDNRGYSESVRIETRVRSCDRLFNIIRELSYTGDISLVETTIAKIIPYIRDEAFLLSFDLFTNRISDKIGISFSPITSIKGTKNLIHFLVENKLCLLEKGQDLIRWKSDELPEGLLVQDINFIKIQFEKNEIVAIKAYLRQSDYFPFYLPKM